MKVEIRGWTVKLVANKRRFSLDIDSPKDKRDRAEIRREMMKYRVKQNLRAVGE